MDNRKFHIHAFDHYILTGKLRVTCNTIKAREKQVDHGTTLKTFAQYVISNLSQIAKKKD